MNKMLKIAALVVSLLVVKLIGLAPIGPMPGVFIGGTQTATPAVWGNTSAEHEIRLKVPGTIPRVVIIWVIIGIKPWFWAERKRLVASNWV